MKGLPWETQKAKLTDPAVQGAMLAEENLPPPSVDMAISFFMLVTAAWAMQFPLGPDNFSYEPTRAESIFGFAQTAAGKDRGGICL